MSAKSNDSTEMQLSKIKHDITNNGADNRLDLIKTSFFGRTKELQLLHTIYEEVSQSSNKKNPVTLISGISGIGKSALVKRFVNEVKNKARKDKKRCFYVCGTYNGSTSEEPFSAIVEAINEFSSELLAGDEMLLERVRRGIIETLGNDAIGMLTHLFPSLKDLIGDSDDFQASADTEYCYSSGHVWNIIKYVFMTFVKIVSTEDHSMIMFLDNLQWIDNDSLQLITSLLTDTSLQHVMFVGAYRSNDADKNQPLSKSLDDVSKVRPLMIIDLLEMPKDEIGKYISDLLGIHGSDGDSDSDEEVRLLLLVEAVYKKTRGNIFFVKEVLDAFQRKQILYYSCKSSRWEWNLENIDIPVEVSDNVVDVIISKIKSLPEKLQRALLIVAHTHAKVDMDTLEMLIQKLEFDLQPFELAGILDQAVLEGILINTKDSKIYDFTNDKIREAAHSLLPPGDEKIRLRESIGRAISDLWFTSAKISDLWFTGAKKDLMLSAAAYHLNNRNTDIKEPERITKLNLQIGEKSLKIAAFNVALEYLQNGLISLKCVKNHWENLYDLSLRLYRALADVELILGHYEEGYKLAKEVFNNATNFNDMLPTYNSMGDALGRQKHHSKAADLYWEALALVDERKKKYPRSRLNWNLRLVSRYFKSRSDEEILNLPIMQDEIKFAAMALYSKAASHAYQSGNLVDWMFIILRRLQITFDYGLCGYTGIALMDFAGVMERGDHQKALRLALLSRKVLEITSAKCLEAQTMFGLIFLVEGWSNHYTETIDTLSHARQLGMNTGDTEFAFKCWAGIIKTGFIAGKPLIPLLSDCTQLLEQIKLFDDQNLVKINEQLHSSLLYLTGRTRTPIDWKELNKFDQPINTTKEIDEFILEYQSVLMLAVYFGEFKFVKKWVKLLKKSSTFDKTYEVSILNTFYTGLALSGLARATGKKKYISMARKEAKKMDHLIKTKGIRSNHRYLIMEADLMTLEWKNNYLAPYAFLNAIDSSLESGHKHDAALCNELAGNYFLAENEGHLAKKHFTEAQNFYEEWGAAGKIEDIKRKCYLIDGRSLHGKSLPSKTKPQYTSLAHCPFDWERSSSDDGKKKEKSSI